MPTPGPTGLIGTEVRRREDPALVQGAGRFVDDLVLPRMAFMAVLRSPHAHARVLRVNTAPASQIPHVLSLFTGWDLQGQVDPEPAVGLPPSARRPPRPLLAREIVRYVGEPVAAVVAEDRYAAADACEAIEVEYAPLPAVCDPEAALAPGATRVHAEFPDNVALTWAWSEGDVEGAFARADTVVRLRLVNQRLAGVPLEPRGCVAEYRAGTLTVWAGTQTPHRLHSGLAHILRLPESRVRVIAPDDGGGFGCKIGFYADEALCAFAAMRLAGRPVKLVLTRREDFLTTTQGRGQVNEVEAAVAVDGTVLALRCRTLADLGAYLEVLTPYPGILTGRLLTGPYRIPAARYELTSMFTNAMATAPYRGAGRPEATYLLERTMDAIARVCNLDPADLLGVPMEDVAVLHGDTAVVPAGVGTFGSRSISVGGPAIAAAAEKVLDKARHVAVVEVDAETGTVRLLRLIAVDDCGRVINPLLVEGQIHGGLAQGIGQALWEQMVYDEGGQCLTASLMDYAIAKPDMLPCFELDRIETPSPVNPLGAKGCGEAGTIGSTPAVVNAVIDALSPLGVTHLDMPLTPARVWAAIQEARS